MIGKLIVYLLVFLFGVWVGVGNADFILGVLGG